MTLTNRFSFLCLTLLSVICTSTLSSRQVLTLDDCLRIARRYSLALRHNANGVRLGGLQLSELNKSALPSVSVQGKAEHAPDAGGKGYDPAITDGGQYSAQIVVQDQLYDGGARGIRSDQIALDLRRLTVEQQQAERGLDYAVTVAYVDALEGRDAELLARHRADELARYRELSERLFRGGGVDYTDVLKIRVSEEQTAIAVQKASENARLKRITLAETIGTPADTAFSLAGDIGETDSVNVDSLLNAVAVDSSHILELRLADADIRRSLLDVDLAKRERYPSVTLNGDVGFLTSGDNLRLAPDQRLNAFGYSIGVTVENLLFNWGSTDLRIEQREVAAEEERVGYEEKRRGIVGELERIRYQVASAVVQLHSLRTTAGLAEDSYVLTKARYAGGGVSALEVLAAEESLAEIRSSQLETRAELQRLVAKVRLWLPQ